MSKKAKVICIANQKGGVGKTTTVMNLGAALARDQKKVLLIDSDPQANLTSYMRVTPGEHKFETLRTLDDVYLSKKELNSEQIESLIYHSKEGPDLIAADKQLSGVELFLFNRSDRETVLANTLLSIRKDYDYILIDTPPNLSLLTINALCASDSVLIPVQPEFFSLEGIVKIREAIEMVKMRWNPSLKILGVLPTQISSRRKLTHDVLETLKAEMGEMVFPSGIHDAVGVAESSGHGLSIMDYAPASKGASDYQAAAKELVARTEKEISA